MPTKIEWAEETWNPVTGCTKVSPGCTKVSPGCKHCYAETQAERFRGTKAFPNGFDLTLKPERLEQPQRWKKPRRIFVNSMSDLFHEGIDDQYIILTYEIMRSTTRHEYLVLTKRAERMREMLTTGLGVYMHPNIWHGVSVENQDYALRRIPDLCDVPSPVRFLSCEPLLGPLDLTPWLHELQWVIVGGESGRGKRPIDLDWAREIRDQCAAGGVPFFMKQVDKVQPIPDDLMIRQDPVLALADR